MGKEKSKNRLTIGNFEVYYVTITIQHPNDWQISVTRFNTVGSLEDYSVVFFLLIEGPMVLTGPT
jgi:hypothetical protein